MSKIICFLFSLISSIAFLKPLSFSILIDNSITNSFKETSRLIENINDENEITNPNDLLALATQYYQEEFPNYLDITALNVPDKESVELENFDINYIAPGFEDIMYTFQNNLELSMSLSQYIAYDNLRRTNYDFDKYVTLNAIKYIDLDSPTKYIHDDNIGVYSVAITSLTTILVSSGIGEAAIAAFTGAVSTMSAALSTSAIPVIGWVLAVVLVVGALIAIAALMVIYWDELMDCASSIQNWFLDQFAIFETFINSYFEDIFIKCDTSTIAGKDNIDGREIIWRSQSFSDAASRAMAMTMSQSILQVHLLKKVKKYYDPITNDYYTNFWYYTGTVTMTFVIKNKLYDFGISTYIYGKTHARAMMEQGSVVLDLIPGTDVREEIINFNTSPLCNGFNHFHIRVYNSETKEYEKIKGLPINQAHSFYGPFLTRGV